MSDGFENFEAALGELALQQLGHAGAEQAILVHNDDGLGGLAGAVVELDEIFDSRGGDGAEAGAEAEGVLQAAVDDLVGNADVADVGEIVAGCRL